MSIRLSSSSIAVFLECSRCFWLQIKKIRRPSSVFPSLPGDMDKILKECFDKHRFEKRVPSEIDGKFKSYLYDNIENFNIWRDRETTERD